MQAHRVCVHRQATDERKQQEELPHHQAIRDNRGRSRWLVEVNRRARPSKGSAWRQKLQGVSSSSSPGRHIRVIRRRAAMEGGLQGNSKDSQGLCGQGSQECIWV